MRKAIINICLVIFTFIITPESSSADDKDYFLISKLGVADKLQDIHIEDVDFDGLKDILITHRKGLSPDESRWISIFYHSPDDGFSPAADQSWEIDTLASIFDTGDIIGDKKKEIIYSTANEIRCYSIDGAFYNNTPSVIFPVEGMMVSPSRSYIPHVNFVRDWNEDGRDDIAVFRFDGLTIFSRDSTGDFTSQNSVNVKIDTRVREWNSFKDETFITSGLTSSFSFPSINLIDYNNDDKRDLIVTNDDKLSVYLRMNDGGFSTEVQKERNFDVRTRKEKIEGTSNLTTTINDLDADGYADAIVTKQTSKGLTNLRGVLNIFRGSPDDYSDSPQQVIISEGTASAETMISDVNGDGRLDLIMPSVKISITSIIRILLTRSLPINFNIFLLNKDGSFSERPDFSKEVKLKIDFSGETDTPAMNLEGDYDGDKRKDFVYATDEDELSIYRGVEDEDKLFSDDAAVEINVNAFGRLSVYDLNDDDYSDIIIRYNVNTEYDGTATVLINLGRI
ncbi:MAG: VCBS repeat-containing protein [Candidatus Krumholzibacteriota bacterium]|nr:VCBS repeat-containing protein [Candidatus Krumholzibacteriota bacterium]